MLERPAHRTATAMSLDNGRQVDIRKEYMYQFVILANLEIIRFELQFAWVLSRP